MASINRFEDLEAWQKGRELVTEVYKTCSSGAQEGLRSERSVVPGRCFLNEQCR